MKSGFEKYALTYGGLHRVGNVTDSAEKNTALIRKCGAEFTRILDGKTDWLEDLPELKEDLFNLIEKGCPTMDIIDLSFACTRGRSRSISDTLESVGLAYPSLQLLAQLCKIVSEKISALNMSGTGVIEWLPRMVPEIPDDEDRARLVNDLYRLPQLLGLYGGLLQLYPPDKGLQAKIEPILKGFELVLFYELLTHFGLGYPTLSRLLRTMRQVRSSVSPNAGYVRQFRPIRTLGEKIPVKDPLGESALQRRLLRFSKENVDWHNEMVLMVERYLSADCRVHRAIGATLLTLVPVLLKPAETNNLRNIPSANTRTP